jgi:hypothetical protein
VVDKRPFLFLIPNLGAFLIHTWTKMVAGLQEGVLDIDPYPEYIKI